MLLGEIKANQETQIKALADLRDSNKKTDDRVAYIEKKLNYALGVVTASVFVFQYLFNYFMKTGKA